MKDAEKAGANITEPLVTLNRANDLLSKASLALANGDYDAALALAAESQQTFGGFNSAASKLKDNALQRGFSDFLISMAGFVLGTVIVVFWAATSCGLFLKRKYGYAGSVLDES